MKHEGFQHQGLIYDGTADYLAGVLPFVDAGLQAGEPVLIAAGAEQNDLLASELGRDAETLRFLDMRALGRNPASMIPLWREFVELGEGRPVRGIGEPASGAHSEAALQECQRHDALLNLAFQDGAAWSLLCPYDARTLPESTLEQVGRSHREVGCGGEMRRSADFEPCPDVLAGELPQPRVAVQSLRFGLSELTEVRVRVASVAERAGLGPLAVADFVTAASELAANSVVHGGGRGVLRLWSEEDSLLAEVEDRGRIEEPLVGRLRPPIHQEGGRGLWLANQLCDLVQIRSGAGRTVVRLHMAAREPALVWHSIEEQALVQMRRAPDLVEGPLADAFRRHLEETESQERCVRERLEAHGASPSTPKDLAGRAGGFGMVLFARWQPDTPLKLALHAFSYEHMEVAAYELLAIAAREAGDGVTAAVAAAIADEEREMAGRVAAGFDEAVEQALAEVEPEDLDEQLNSYLSDVHALEGQSQQLLEKSKEMEVPEPLRSAYAHHLAETDGHLRQLERRLRERGASPSALKDAALRLGALNWGMFFAAQPDTPAKLAGFSYAVENLEVAAYELLRRVAERAGDEETVALADSILAEERSAAAALAAQWPNSMAAV